MTRRIGIVLAAAAMTSLVATAAVGAQNSSDPGSDAVPAPPGAPAPAAQVGAQAVAASNGTLYFSIDNDNTLYSLDVNTAEPTEIGPTGVDSDTVGLTEGPDAGVLIGSTWQDRTFINIDGSGFDTVADSLMQAEGLAFDPATQTLYKFWNGSGFHTADLSTGAIITDLADPPADVQGLAWRSTDGRVYGFGDDSDTLYRYSPGSDSWSAVGSTGISPSRDAGLAWDPIADVLYAIVSGDSGALLYRIDPDTAEATLIGDTGLEDGGGLAFIAAEQPPPPPPPPVVLEPRFTG